MSDPPSQRRRWIGKALGVTAACALAPSDLDRLLALVLLGLALGHAADLWFERRERAKDGVGTNDASRSGAAPDDPPFMHFTFAGMGAIAKASGSVSKREIEGAQRVMQQLGLGPAVQRRAREWFRDGKSASCDFEALAARCRAETDDAATQSRLALECLCLQLHAERDDAGHRRLVELGALLGFPESSVEATLDATAREPAAAGQQQNARPDAGNSQAAPPPRPQRDAQLDAALRVLGVAHGASLADVKTAYRRQVARCHPDRLPANTSKRDIDAANARMNALRAALELIEARHAAG